MIAPRKLVVDEPRELGEVFSKDESRGETEGPIQRINIGAVVLD